jgi:hypothetical protein
LVVVIFGAIPGIGSDYQYIGNGGQDRITLDSKNFSTHGGQFEIFLGLPYTADFYIPQENSSEFGSQENRSTILDYVNNETLKGHVFVFQGRLIVGNFEKFTVDISPPGKIIIKDMDDLICRQGYEEPRSCYVYSGYLIDHEGNLMRLEELRILPDSEFGLKYEGTGYLVRVQCVTDLSTSPLVTVYVPDPGQYDVTWSNVERRQ